MEIARVENLRKALEQETALSEQRRRQMEEEYEMLLRKEQLRADYVAELQKQQKQQMDELQAQIVEVNKKRNAISVENSKLEEEVARCNEAIKKFQELDTFRQKRAEEFRDKRHGLLEKFQELLIMQVRHPIFPISDEISPAILVHACDKRAWGAWSAARLTRRGLWCAAVGQDGLRRMVEEVRQPVARSVSFFNRNHASVAPAKTFNAFAYTDKSEPPFKPPAPGPAAPAVVQLNNIP